MLFKRSLSGKEELASFRWTLSFMPVYIVVFSAFLDTHAQMPILAPFAVSLGAGPFLVGLAVGSYSLFNIFGNFVAGAVIDRDGWRRPLLFGLLGSSLALYFYTIAPHAPALIAVRSGHGLAGGFLVPAALSCLASLRRSEEQGAAVASRMAFFGVAVGLAALAGPPLSGLVASRWGYPSVYVALSGIMFAVALIAMSLRSAKQRIPLQAASRFGHYRIILSSPPILAASFFALGVMGATGTLAAFFPSWAQELGLSPPLIGLIFAAFALSAIAIQGLWPFYIQPRLTESVWGALAGLPLLSISLLLIPFSGSVFTLFAIFVIYGAGFGLAFQAMLSLVAGSPDSSWRGKAAGFFFAFYSLGAALVPPTAGFLWERIPFLNPFYTGSAVVLLFLTVGILFIRK